MLKPPAGILVFRLKISLKKLPETPVPIPALSTFAYPVFPALKAGFSIKYERRDSRSFSP
jgi:hypothetical protein